MSSVPLCSSNAYLLLKYENHSATSTVYPVEGYGFLFNRMKISSSIPSNWGYIQNVELYFQTFRDGYCQYNSTIVDQIWSSYDCTTDGRCITGVKYPNTNGFGSKILSKPLTSSDIVYCQDNTAFSANVGSRYGSDMLLLPEYANETNCQSLIIKPNTLVALENPCFNNECTATIIDDLERQLKYRYFSTAIGGTPVKPPTEYSDPVNWSIIVIAIVSGLCGLIVVILMILYFMRRCKKNAIDDDSSKSPA